MATRPALAHQEGLVDPVLHLPTFKVNHVGLVASCDCGWVVGGSSWAVREAASRHAGWR